MKKTALSLAFFCALTATCLSQNAQFFTVPDPDFELVFEIKTFPNPATGRVFIETDFPGPMVFRLFSMAGQCAKSGQLTSGEIDVAKLPNGLYCLELRTADGRFLTTVGIEKW